MQVSDGGGLSSAPIGEPGMFTISALYFFRFTVAFIIRFMYNVTEGYRKAFSLL